MVRSPESPTLREFVGQPITESAVMAAAAGRQEKGMERYGEVEVMPFQKKIGPDLMFCEWFRLQHCWWDV